MKENSLKDEHELQSYFIQRMEKYVNQKGKTLIGWDEILEGGLAPKAVVMSWRGEEGGIAAAKQKHNVIMTPGGWVYFDHSQSENEDSVTIGGFTSVEKVYGYEPVPAALNADDANYVLGAQANVWTEYMKNTRKIEYMIFPRMSALSEVLWSPKGKRNLPDFEKRLQTQFKRYDLWRANYSKAFLDLKATVLPTDDYNGVLWKLESKSKNDKIFYASAQDSSTPAYKDPIRITFSWQYSAILRDDKNSLKGNWLRQKFFINKATGKKITISKEPSKNYPGDGAFTLVNGVQNEKGLSRSKEILGWSGDDLEATMDLGSSQTISSAVVHSLSSGGSWVYPPQYAELLISQDGQTFSSAGKSETFEKGAGSNGLIKLSFNPVSARYVKVIAKNLGIIPEGMRGAGNKAWLFVDEIEVN
jgi:hexosaminidase